MELGMPASLSELGVRVEHIPDLVERTLADANASTNPVPLDQQKLERLFGWAIRGKMA
jgi:alcohol dehydrogenase class IV